MAVAQPFDLPGAAGAPHAADDTAVLCLHGFTSSPYEVRYLGEALARRGYAVHGPMLPGHGTSLEDLDGKTWRDWTDFVAERYDALAARHARVAVVGQSLGGLLSLHLATRRPVAAVATLAAPLWLDGLARHAAEATGPRGILRKLVTRLPKLGGPDVLDTTVKRENPAYDWIPTRALAQLVDFMGVVDAELSQITAPVLVVHATQDHTAPVACAHRIAARTRPGRAVILPRSYHLIAVDVERDQVAAEVAHFFAEHISHSPHTGE